MKKKRLLMLVGSICISLMLLALLLPACAAEEEAPEAPAVPAVPEVEEEVYRMKFQTTSRPGTRGYELDTDWANFIERASNGRIQIDFYGADEVVGVFEHPEAVIGGILDGAGTCSCYIQGIVPAGYFFYGPATPVMTPFQMQYLYWYLEPTNWEEVYREAALEQAGFHVVSSSLVSSYGQTQSTKPLRRLSDVVGTKFRSYSLVAKVWEEVGASMVTTTGAEMYTALALGTIEATNYAGGNLEWEFGLHEVAKYRNMTAIQPMCETNIFWNLDSWNALPPDLQEIIETAGRLLALRDLSTSYYDDFLAVKNMVEEWGVELTEYPKEDIEELTRVGLMIMERDAREGPYADKYTLELSNILFDYMREIGLVE